MSSASFRKNRFFGLGRRLAASEGAKIVGGASLARRENPWYNSRPSVRKRVLRVLGPPWATQAAAVYFPAMRQGKGLKILSRRLQPTSQLQPRTVGDISRDCRATAG